MGWSIGPISEFNSYEIEWVRLNSSVGNTPLLVPCFIDPLLVEFATGGVRSVLG